MHGATTQQHGDAVSSPSRRLEVTAGDLPLHCPMPQMRLWDSHPRVFIDMAHSGHASCPYCGTEYVLKAG